MEWIEVKIYTTREGIEPVSAMLIDAGINGIEIEDDQEIKEFVTTSSKYWDYVDEELLNKKIEDTRIKVYVSNNAYGYEILMKIKEGLNRLKNIDIGFDLGKLSYELQNMNDKNWLDKWKEFYKPFKVGKKLIIKPIWENIENNENRIVFNINPGHVFGTGLHQTTQLCIIELEKYVNNNSIVLDLGCGSGILSIISILLGAKNAVAIDIDCNAVKTAYENAEFNKIGKDKYYVTSGNIIEDISLQEEIGYNKYDIVIANIIADVIVEMSNIIPKHIKSKGIFIASGIIKERIQDVYDALNKNNFEVIATNIRDEWVSITSVKK